MPRRAISEIVNAAAAERDPNRKAMILRENDHVVLRNLLRMAIDPYLQWALPEGPVPYKPCEYEMQQGRLYQEARRLYLFHQGGRPDLKPGRREMLFVQLLESIDPKDAEFLINVRNKKLPNGLTKEDILRAYPGLI